MMFFVSVLTENTHTHTEREMEQREEECLALCLQRLKERNSNLNMSHMARSYYELWYRHNSLLDFHCDVRTTLQHLIHEAGAGAVAGTAGTSSHVVASSSEAGPAEGAAGRPGGTAALSGKGAASRKGLSPRETVKQLNEKIEAFQEEDVELKVHPRPA